MSAQDDARAPNLVAAAAHGSRRSDVLLFLGSLRSWVSPREAEVTLFVTDVRVAISHRASSRHQITAYQEMRLVAQEYQASLQPTNITGRATADGRPISSSVMYERFLWYARACSGVSGWCLATDAHDVWFQANPFARILPRKADLILSQEDSSITIGGVVQVLSQLHTPQHVVT